MVSGQRRGALDLAAAAFAFGVAPACAQLSEPDKIRMRSINQELSKLSTDFSNKLLAGTKVGALVVDNVDVLTDGGKVSIRPVDALSTYDVAHRLAPRTGGPMANARAKRWMMSSGSGRYT